MYYPLKFINMLETPIKLYSNSDGGNDNSLQSALVEMRAILNRLCALSFGGTNPLRDSFPIRILILDHRDRVPFRKWVS